MYDVCGSAREALKSCGDSSRRSSVVNVTCADLMLGAQFLPAEQKQTFSFQNVLFSPLLPPLQVSVVISVSSTVRNALASPHLCPSNHACASRTAPCYCTRDVAGSFVLFLSIRIFHPLQYLATHTGRNACRIFERNV